MPSAHFLTTKLRQFCILGATINLAACTGDATTPASSSSTPFGNSSQAMSSQPQNSSSIEQSSASEQTSSSSELVSSSSEPSSASEAQSSSETSSIAASSSSVSMEPEVCLTTLDGQPYCLLGDQTDADENGTKDGWGWEQDASCIVPSGIADTNPRDCAPKPPVLPPSGGGNSASFINYDGKEVYLSGFNIAWFEFAGDVNFNGLDENKLREALSDVSTAGGNSLRWWIHTDGSRSPAWGDVNGENMVTSPGANTIADLEAALDIAAEYNVYLIPALWSFDMLLDNDYRNPPTADNYRLLSDDAVLQSYIDNALRPMVKALNKHPQLIAWELFNEPENMTEGWFRDKDEYYDGTVPTKAQLQRTQAKMAAAIHREAITSGETALVTTGSKSMGKYNSDVAGGENWYRDDRMIAAADGDTQATLDFYEPHYYNNENRNGAWSPFHHDANYWGVDKPIVIGEFYVKEALDVLDDRVEANQLCQRLVDKGYAGSWAWQWTENELRQGVVDCVMNAQP